MASRSKASAKISDTWDQLVQRAQAGTTALVDKLRGVEAERDKLKADFETHLDQDQKAKSAFVDVIGKIESALVLLIMAGLTALVLYYAPGNTGEKVASTGFTSSLTQT